MNNKQNPINMNLDHCIFCATPYSQFPLFMYNETMDYFRCESCDKTWKFIEKDGKFRSIYFQFGDNETGITLSIRCDNSWSIKQSDTVNFRPTHFLLSEGTDASSQWNIKDLEEMKRKIEMYELMA